MKGLNQDCILFHLYRKSQSHLYNFLCPLTACVFIGDSVSFSMGKKTAYLEVAFPSMVSKLKIPSLIKYQKLANGEGACCVMSPNNGCEADEHNV